MKLKIANKEKTSETVDNEKYELFPTLLNRITTLHILVHNQRLSIYFGTNRYILAETIHKSLNV